MSKEVKITALLDKGLSVKDITKRLKVPAGYVYTARWKAKKKTKTKYKSPRSRLIQDIYQMKKALNVIEEKKSDPVNSPPHYNTGGIEYWDFAEAKGLTENAYLFNAGKYIVRCGKKEGADPIQDLEKAIKFIQRDIDRRKRA